MLDRAEQAVVTLTGASRGEVGEPTLAFLGTTANYLPPGRAADHRGRLGRHARRGQGFRRAGYEPNIVQRAAGVQSLLGLVAAGVGRSRPARSAHSLRRTGVVFVPLAGERASTQVLWLPDADTPALHRLLEVVTEPAARTDLTESG